MKKKSREIKIKAFTTSLISTIIFVILTSIFNTSFRLPIHSKWVNELASFGIYFIVMYLCSLYSFTKADKKKNS